jgi:hypothetical protein
MAAITAIAVWAALLLLVEFSASRFPPAAWMILAGALVATAGVAAIPRSASTAAFAFVAGSQLPWIPLPTGYAFLALPLLGLAGATVALVLAAQPPHLRRHALIAAAGLAAGFAVVIITWIMASPASS